MDTCLFQKNVYDHFKKGGRDLPWRHDITPYKVLVSEMMLQQTQVDRVIPKFEVFVQEFPDFAALATASVGDVITTWQGLGYNRRALALKKCAEIVSQEYGGQLPSDTDKLTELPGIGQYTAAAIQAFAFNLPSVVIETNIRTVFIHIFFKNKKKVSDEELLPFIEQSIDKKNPRSWYNALMDYGAMLKEKFPNPSRKSTTYSKQSKFEGSDRQIRGLIVKALAQHKELSVKELIKTVKKNALRVKKQLAALEKEGFVVNEKNIVQMK